MKVRYIAVRAQYQKVTYLGFQLARIETGAASLAPDRTTLELYDALIDGGLLPAQQRTDLSKISLKADEGGRPFYIQLIVTGIGLLAMAIVAIF
jgi:hypothetical protein